jgi:hypothetical protein
MIIKDNKTVFSFFKDITQKNYQIITIKCDNNCQMALGGQDA